MSTKSPQSFARDAENNVADQLAMRVSRFRKAKKNRKVLAADAVKWAGELLKLVSALSVETALPSPVPPLASPQERKEQASEQLDEPIKTIEQMLVDLKQFPRDSHAPYDYIYGLLDEELNLLDNCAEAKPYSSAIALEVHRRRTCDSIES